MSKQDISLVNIAYTKDFEEDNKSARPKGKDLGVGTWVPGTSTIPGGSGISLSEQRSEYQCPSYSEVQPPGYTVVHIQPVTPPAQVLYAQDNTRSYCEYAVFGFLCCFFPFGIVALINAYKVRLALAEGDYDEAKRRSSMARCCSLVTILTGVGIALMLVIVLSLCLP